MTDSITEKVKRLVISGAIIFIVNMGVYYLFPILSVSELGPSSALPPIFGLIFGPWGALGSALGYLASDIVSGESPQIYIVYFFIQFLYGYIPYKLWYTLDREKTNSLPRLDTVGNLTKFVMIMFINAVVLAGFLGFLLDGMGLYDLVSLTTVLFALNNFDFSIMFGSLIIIGANLYGISMHRPDVTEKTLIAPKIFDVVIIIAIIVGVVNVIYSAFAEPDIYSLVAGTITYSLVLLYVLKPVTKTIREKSGRIKLSLTEKLIVIFIITGAIIAIVTGIISFITITGNVSDLEFWETVLFNITLILSIFYISSIGFLWYIEKNITIPIESISDFARNYIRNSKGISDDAGIIAKCQEYASQDSEVGVLARSFEKMIGDLKVYIENLEKVTAERERINTELNVARKIQEDMLPKNFDDVGAEGEFSIYATNIPAREVGGDFYDFFMVDVDHLALVIGDVSGKGMPAALFMVIAKTLIKNYSQLGKEPVDVFTMVNNQLCEGNDEGMFVTAWMGVLEISTGKFTYVNAGHNPPLLKHADKDYTWLKSKPGFVLGGMEDIQYYQKEIVLKPGSRVFLYTDGVTEAINDEEELFGDKRLMETVNSQQDPGLKKICNHVQGEIDEFASDKEQFDDITMLVMEYEHQL